MLDRKSQSSARPKRRAGALRAAALAAFAALVLIVPRASAGSSDTDPEGPEVFGLDTGIGRLEYHAGRGLRVGDTGLTIGGYATAEAQRLEGGESFGGVEGVNFLVALDPVPYLHLFTELEAGPIARAETGEKGVRSGDGVDVDRLYLDAGTSDRLNLRFGEFLTPFGRWNQTPADPFLWTASEPLITEGVFDEIVKGAMLWGTVFPRGGALSYSLYGTFLPPITRDPGAPQADYGSGARLEWASLEGWTLGASYFGSQERNRKWTHLGGADALWQPTARLELSAETAFGKGTRDQGSLWGLYGQAVVETVRTLYAVGRYEHFDPPRGPSVELFDVGLTWIPVYYVRLKADYRFADRFNDLSQPGLRASFSLLF